MNIFNFDIAGFFELGEWFEFFIGIDQELIFMPN